MPEETNISLLQNLIDKLEIFMQRPQVQSQIITIGVVLILALLLSRMLWLIISRRLHSVVDTYVPKRLRPFLHFVLYLFQAITFSTLGLLLLREGRDNLLGNHQVVGLLDKFVWILWEIFIFQTVITIMYAIFNDEVFRRYHYRLLIPLFVLSLFLVILNNVTAISNIANIVLTTIFDNQITLGALFIATFGLYFWTDAVYVASELVYEFIKKRTSLDPGSTKAILTLGRYVLIIAGVVVALNQLQLDATTLTAITGGLSVGVGFGLREILSNFVSGVLLLFERSLHPGDVIEVDGEISIVRDFSIRATTVRTLNNEELVIPNMTFFTSSFKTYTGTDKTVRVPIPLRTDCNISPEHVVKVLQEAALSVENVMSDPAPTVFLLEYADNVASFQLNVWLDNPLTIPAVKSQVKFAAWHALAEHDIALPFPEVELHFPKRLPLELTRPRSNHQHQQETMAEPTGQELAAT
ncbi:MAG: mechanosensitive ion channel domain-containing protein [Chloroflexota bacterium]